MNWSISKYQLLPYTEYFWTLMLEFFCLFPAHGLTLAGDLLMQYDIPLGVVLVTVVLWGEMYTSCLLDTRRGDDLCGRTWGKGDNLGWSWNVYQPNCDFIHRQLLETKQYRKSIHTTNFSNTQVAKLNDIFETHPCITFVTVSERQEVKSSASLFHSKEKVGATHK